MPVDVLVSITLVLFVLYFYICALNNAVRYPVRFVIGTMIAMAVSEPIDYWISIPFTQYLMFALTTAKGLKVTLIGFGLGGLLSKLTNRSYK